MAKIVTSDVLLSEAGGAPTGVSADVGDIIDILGEISVSATGESFTKIRLVNVPGKPEGWVHSDVIDATGAPPATAAINPEKIARECVRQAVLFGVSAHYLMAVAKLRSGLTDDVQGSEVGPFRIAQADWNANRTDPAFDLALDPPDISNWRLQCAVFALMARRAMEKIMATQGGTPPSAIDLYRAQSPEANQTTLLGKLTDALKDTADAITKAGSEVLGDPNAPPDNIATPQTTLFRVSESGMARVRGHLVEKVQNALIKSGDLAATDAAGQSGNDGVFGPGTAAALRAWQKKNGFLEADELTHEQWNKLTSEPPPDIYERCAQVTAAFENATYGFGHVNKTDFDNTGLTFGYHGYTVSGGNLQKFLQLIDNKHPGLLDTIFGSAMAADLRKLFPPVSAETAKALAKTIFFSGSTVTPEWTDAFRKFGETPECKAGQIAFSREEYWKPAELMRSTLRIAEPLSHALCFDVSVQNGPGRGQSVANSVASGLSATMDEETKRLRFAEKIAANSSFSSDVRSRKVETLVDGDGTVHDARYRLSDWGLIPPEGNDLDPPGTGGMGLSNAAFDAFFAATFPGLTAFSASDFLVKGGKHAVNHLNTDPPKALWPNVVKLVNLLVELQKRLGNPKITFNSVYRSPKYNASVGGASGSQHMQFCAADIVVHGHGGPTDWARELSKMRSAGIFAGGIGRYNSFVHVDTRGYNANWG